MFKAFLIAFSAALLPHALAVCSSGDLAIGITTIGFNDPTSATLWDSNCDVLDFHSGFDICGSYDDGSTVICNAGTETPNSAQTGNGIDYGNCFQVSETCSPDGTVSFCCSPA